jgi:broad specificity phosphatase PhoE
MNAKVILVMRHAEKSDDPLDPNLTPAGYARARRLAEYIPATFGKKPQWLFASAGSKHSRRSIQTLEPLATRCRLTIDETYADQDYGALADHLRKSDAFDGALVVVCWHHGNIPPMMRALKAPADDYPDPWKRHVFNLILQVKIAKDREIPLVTRVSEPF